MTILNVEVHNALTTIGSISLVIMFFMIMLAVIFVANDGVGMKFAICTIAIIVSIGIIVGKGFEKINYYEVTVDASYPASELLGKYKIIETKGKILVVTELEKEK